MFYRVRDTVCEHDEITCDVRPNAIYGQDDK